MAEWDNDDDVFSGWVSDRFLSQSAAATSSYAQMKKMFRLPKTSSLSICHIGGKNVRSSWGRICGDFQRGTWGQQAWLKYWQLLVFVRFIEVKGGEWTWCGHTLLTTSWLVTYVVIFQIVVFFLQKWKPVQNAGGTVWCLLWGKFWSQFVHRLCGPMSACPMLTRCENPSKKKKSDGCPCVTVSWSPMWSHVGHSLSATACSPLDCCSREARSVTRLLCNSYNSSMVEPGWLNPHAHFPL